MIPAIAYPTFTGRVWLWTYLGSVHLAAVTLLAWLLPGTALDPSQWSDVGFWFLLSLVAHLVAFQVGVFGGQVIRFSVGYAASTACIILFPPGWAALLVGLSSMSWPQLTGKTPWHKVAFNRSMFVLSAGLAALGFDAGERLGVTGPGGTLILSLICSLVYFLVNSGLLTVAVALSSQQSLSRVWVFSNSFSLFFSYVTLGVMGVLLSLIYNNIGWWGVVIASIPLTANYYALRYISLLRQSYTQVVQVLGDTLDLREYRTGGHSLRVGALARRVGEEMGLGRNELEHLYLGGTLHDVGKIALDDKILLGAGRLDAEEWEKVRMHPDVGSRLLEPYPQLERAAAIVRHHHERWDGSGYPQGLKGSEIPLGSRIVMVVDAFDVMYFGRPYQQPRPWDDVCDELKRCAGTQFDPAAVTAFLRLGQRQIMAAIPATALPEAISRAH